MLESMMKFGNHRVDYFVNRNTVNSQSVAFYIRGEMDEQDAYSRDAKHQLYLGLAILEQKVGMRHVTGIYVDVNDLNNIERPAYLRMKQDLEDGLFKKVFVLSADALLGDPTADADMCELYRRVGGFELFSCDTGDCAPLDFPVCCQMTAVG